jgi:hypothetical protein
MKKLLTICLIMATMFTVNAQDGKPTKEQTIEFIKEYYVNNRLHTGIISGDSKKEFKHVGIEKRDIRFTDNNEVTFDFDYYYKYSNYSDGSKLVNDIYTKLRYVVDFSKIESINLVIDLINTENLEISLILKCTNGYSIESFEAKGYDGFDDLKLPNIPDKKNNITIPINYYKTSNANFNHSEYNKKVIQAFNHLRKLCGAPEPISFD